MSEKFSSFERVVGDIPAEEKAQILKEIDEQFNDQAFESLKGKERDKTPEELEIISLANKATNGLLKEYGLEDFDIPPQNIYVIEEEHWPEDLKGSAFYNSIIQGVAIRETLSKTGFLKKTLHEMLHFKSYNALQITTGGEDEDRELQEYRSGLVVAQRDGRDVYFVSLNEAVTEELAMRLLTQLPDKSIFQEEIEQTKKIMDSYPNATSRGGDPLFDDETIYAKIEEEEPKNWRESIGRKFGFSEGRKKIITEKFTRKEEREMLNVLIEKIKMKNESGFKNKEEVFDIFARGYLTGNILPLVRLVDKTFGKGTMRKIGELDSDMEQQKQFIESL